MPRRVIIIGGPRTGKSTLSERLQSELGIETLHNSAELESLFPVDRPESWSQQSEHASKWFDEDGDSICEGVQMARALRKWLRANPGKPLDADLFLLRQPMVPQRDGQKAMMKGVESVFREIEPELIRRGARVQKLKDPKDAIEVLLARDTQDTTTKARGLMALPKGYTKAEWDALPEANRLFFEQQKIYVPDGENWKLDGLEDPEGVTRAVENERKVSAALKKQLQELQAKYDGVDPDKAREAQEKLDQLEQDTLQKSGDVKAMLEVANKKFAEKEAQYQKIIAEKDDVIKGKDSTIQAIVVDQELTTAIAKHKGAPEILLPVIKAIGEVKAVPDGDRYVPRVFKDGNTETPVFGDTKGNPMTMEQYVEQLKQHPVYARAFEPVGNGGMGAGSGGGGGNANTIKLSREAVKHNNQLYVSAKEQAAKTNATIEFVD